LAALSPRSLSIARLFIALVSAAMAAVAALGRIAAHTRIDNPAFKS
jgi:hypothetical protein